MARDIFGNLEDCPDDDRGTSAVNQATENSYHFKNILALLDQNTTEPETAQDFLSYAATFPPTPTIPPNNAKVTDNKGSIHDGCTNVMSTTIYRSANGSSSIEEEEEVDELMSTVYD